VPSTIARARLQGPWLSGVADDAQVVAGHEECIAVELDSADGGVVDDLVLRGIAHLDGEVRLPQLDEARALAREVANETPDGPVGGIARRGHPKVRDYLSLEVRLFLGCVPGARTGTNEVAPDRVALDSLLPGYISHECRNHDEGLAYGAFATEDSALRALYDSE